jgi:hypothetical protein
MLTDGQVHDVPGQPTLGVPLHLLLPGRPARWTGASACWRRRASASSAAPSSCG